MAVAIKFPRGPYTDPDIEPPQNLEQIGIEHLLPVRGNTNFGHYDDDPRFRLDSKKFALYAARRLGFPEMSIEIYEVDFYSAMEEATDEFSMIVTEQNIEDNLTALLGTDPDADKNGVWVKSDGQQQAMEIADQYGAHTQGLAAGGNVERHKGFFWTEDQRQRYHMSEIRTSEEVRPGEYEYVPIGDDEPIVVDRVFYERSLDSFTGFSNSAMLGTGFYPSHSIGGGVGLFQDTLRPLSGAMSQLQNRELYIEMFGAQRSFEIVNKHISLYPVPNKTRPVWVEFKYRKDLREAGATESGVVSDFSNAPYQEFLKYSAINAASRRWIYRYALQVARHNLGTVRTKFSDIPGPQDSFQLDGEDLKSQAQTKMDSMRDQLRQRLEQLSRENRMQKLAQESQYLNEYLSRTPTKIYRF